MSKEYYLLWVGGTIVYEGNEKFLCDNIEQQFIEEGYDDVVVEKIDAKVTNKMIEKWLGTSNPLAEAVDIIKEIANGDYSLESLNQDIMEYYEGDE